MAASGAGADDPAKERPGQYMQSLAAINRIRTRTSRHGSKTSIDLPQAVIAGDQSSGKSSLLEAYSAVSLPFGTGTQTKCPTEIDMHPSEDGTRSFQVQDKDVKDDGIVDAIKKAQAGILTEEGKEPSEIVFSKTPIRVKATTEFKERLTILDMPGLHASKEEGSDIVQQLLQDQIKGPRSLIIAVGEAGQDEQRHRSFQLAREADPGGLRTIKVFTKCDVSDGKDADDLIHVRIKEAAKQLQSGSKFAPHFVIARLGGERGAWTHEKEIEVFRSTFKMKDELLSSGVVGVDSLRKRTEELLSKIVLLNIPKMLAEIQSAKYKAQDQLKEIGTEPKSKEYMIQLGVTSIMDVIDTLGQKHSMITEVFEENAKRINDENATDEEAVRAEIRRRLSPYELHLYLGRFAISQQLKQIGTEFGQLLDVYLGQLMKLANDELLSSINLFELPDAEPRPAFKQYLRMSCRKKLREVGGSLAAEFKRLADRSRTYYTRNAHYIDENSRRPDAAKLKADARLLKVLLPDSGSATEEQLIDALQKLEAARPVRSIEDQVVDRVMLDLPRYAKAQLKEFQSTVSATIKEQLIGPMQDWARSLYSDKETHEHAGESDARTHLRAEINQRLRDAVANEEELLDLDWTGSAAVSTFNQSRESAEAGGSKGSSASGAVATAVSAGAIQVDWEQQMRGIGTRSSVQTTGKMRGVGEFVDSIRGTIGSSPDADIWNASQSLGVKKEEEAAFSEAMRQVVSAQQQDKAASEAAAQGGAAGATQGQAVRSVKAQRTKIR